MTIFTIKNRQNIMLEVANIRSVETDSSRDKLLKIVSGEKGEQFVLEKIISELKSKPIVVKDYLFEVNSMECQIDFLLIFQNECVLVEVKNYVGVYRVEDGEMYFASNGERLVKSPFRQVEKAKLLLDQLFKEEDIRLSICEKIVFPNELFYLYNDSVSMPTVYHTTFSNFLKELNQKRCTLGEYHQEVLEKLKRRRLLKSKYEQPIIFLYDAIPKGITCKCGGWMKSNRRKKVTCETCFTDEDNDSAIMRMVEHFIAVFPDRKLTAAEIYYWIGGELSRSTISRILNRYLQGVGTTKNREFLVDDDSFNH